MTGSRVDDILSALSRGGPESSWPDRLVEECRVATQMSGVGLALMGGGAAAGLLAATSGHAQQMEEAAYTVFDAGAPEADEAPEAPAVIAETRTDIPECSVADAVMMLDLRHTNALFFKNAGTGRHNMVYRRDDGSIGWVEPS